MKFNMLLTTDGTHEGVCDLLPPGNPGKYWVYIQVGGGAGGTCTVYSLVDGPVHASVTDGTVGSVNEVSQTGVITLGHLGTMRAVIQSPDMMPRNITISVEHLPDDYVFLDGII